MFILPAAGPEQQAPRGTLAPWIEWRVRNSFNRRVFLRLQEACGYRPLPWQAEAHLAGATLAGQQDHKAAIGGFGAGKTAFGAAELLSMVLANPGAIWLACEPSYDQIQEVMIPAWEEAVFRLESHGYPVSVRGPKGIRGGPQQDELVCGGRVLFRSYAVLEKLRGLEAAGAWTDEIDTVIDPDKVWAILLSRVRLTKTKRRRATRGQVPISWRQIVATTTPQGIRGCVRAFDSARRAAIAEDRREDLRQWYWTRITWRDNHHLPADYADNMRSTYSRRRWEQEAEAKILAPESAIYAEYDERHQLLWPAFDPSLPYDLGVDGGDEFPHVLWIQRLGDHRAVVFDELCEDMGRDQCVAEVKARCARMGKPPRYIAIDRNPPAIRSLFQRAFGTSTVRWAMTRDQLDVNSGIETVRALFDPVMGDPRLFVAEHLTQHPPRRGIHRCLRNYRYQQRPDGSITNRPYKDWIHDHGADALRYWAVLVGTDPGPSVRVTSRYGPGGGGDFKLPHQR